MVGNDDTTMPDCYSNRGEFKSKKEFGCLIWLSVRQMSTGFEKKRIELT